MSVEPQNYSRSTWRPGHRHAVATAVYGWTCVDCRAHFDVWPSDDAECPGPSKVIE